MRTSPRVLLAVCMTGGAVLAPAVPALAQGATGTASVKPAAEAWYRVTPTCGAPTGCADVSTIPSPYAADTLHVGVNAGQEEARTYLQLDLAPLPSGTKPTGGTLLLPVAAALQDGTRSPASAKLRACAVTAPVQDADGTFTAPPAPDCSAASVPATFVAATAEDPSAFTVDLAALTAAWQAGAAPGGIALVAAEETAAPDTWHVAFSDRTRTGEGVVPIVADIAFLSSAVDTTDAPPPVVPVPAFEPAPAPAFDASFEVPQSFAAPAPAFVAPQLPAPAAQTAPAPAAAPVQQVVPVASFVQDGFRYPAVFLLPLLLAIGLGWLGRALTRDLSAD